MRRRAIEPYDHRGRRLTVELRAGDVIAIKEERTRKWFIAPINRVYVQLIRWNIKAERAEKKARKRNKNA